MSYFIVKDKHLIRKKSSKIDRNTNPRYLKLKINHKKEYEDLSKDDVLEIIANKRIEIEKAALEARKKKQKIMFSLKKNKNYFIDFLRKMNKNNQQSIKAIGKDSLIPDLLAINFNKKLSRKFTTTNKKSSLTENNKSNMIKPSIEMKEKGGIHLALIPSSRMKGSALLNLKLSTQIDDNEAYVLTFKSSSSNIRSLSKMGSQSRTCSVLGYSGSKLYSGSKIHDNSLNRNSVGFVLSKIKGKTFKLNDSEYIFIKAMINSPIDIEDLVEKEKYVEENMNYSKRYENILVYFNKYFYNLFSLSLCRLQKTME